MLVGFFLPIDMERNLLINLNNARCLYFENKPMIQFYHDYSSRESGKECMTATMTRVCTACLVTHCVQWKPLMTQVLHCPTPHVIDEKTQASTELGEIFQLRSRTAVWTQAAWQHSDICIFSHYADDWNVNTQDATSQWPRGHFCLLLYPWRGGPGITPAAISSRNSGRKLMQSNPRTQPSADSAALALTFTRPGGMAGKHIPLKILPK